MEMIRDALSPERLDAMRKMFDAEGARSGEEARAVELARSLGRRRDEAEEERERRLWEKKKRKLAGVRPCLVLAAAIPLLGLGSCSQLSQTVSTICQDVAKAEATPLVVAALDAQDPHGQLGVLWADAKSACAGTTVAAGVSTDWAGLIWGEVKVLAPTLLPILIGML